MTLIEISVALVIAAIISISATTLLMGSLDGWSRGTSETYSATSASIAAQKVAQEIRDGESASVASGRLTVVIPQKTTGAHNEIYYTRGVAGDTRIYYYDSATSSLKRSVNGAVSTLLRRISGATFTASGKVVTITISSWEKVGDSTTRQDGTIPHGGDGTRQAYARVHLRN